MGNKGPNSAAGQILGYSFLVVFANDGIIDADEFKFLKELALRDRVIDDDERDVLRVIFDRPDPKEMSIEVKNDIKRFRQQYQI